MSKPRAVPMGVYKAIARFERAVDDMALKGSYEPARRPLVEQEYQDAKANLILKIKTALES